MSTQVTRSLVPSCPTGVPLLCTMLSATREMWFKSTIDPHSQNRTANYISAKFGVLGLWIDHVPRLAKPLFYKHKYWGLLKSNHGQITEDSRTVQEELNTQGHISPTYLKAVKKLHSWISSMFNHRNRDMMKLWYFGSKDQKLCFYSRKWIRIFKVFSKPKPVKHAGFLWSSSKN